MPTTSSTPSPPSPSFNELHTEVIVPHVAPKPHKWLALGAILITLLSWSSAFVAVRFLREDFSPGSLTLGRMAVAFALLGIFNLIRPSINPSDPSGATALWPNLMRRSRWWLVIACGVAWFAIYHIMLNWSVHYIDAATSAVITNIGPILIAIGAAIFLGERFTAPLAVGMSVAFAGVLIMAVGPTEGVNFNTIGVWLALGPALMYAVGMILQKQILPFAAPLPLTWILCGIGTLVCLPFLPQLITELGQVDASRIWLLIFVGAVPTALAFVMWAFALSQFKASQLGVATYLVPIFSAGMGWLFLHETPPSIVAIGAVVCLVGVYITRMKFKKPQPMTSE